jgi:hypothetical protein
MPSSKTLNQQVALPSPGKRLVPFATLTLLIVLAGGLLRLALAWRDLGALDTLFFPDDTYLSLGIARNIALGFGSTFDRQIPTNGYQPLYVWLMTPVYWMLPDDRVLPIHIALTLLALASTATGWLIYRIVERLATPWHAMIACAIWMFDPIVLMHSMNGLETGIAMLGIAATTFWYLTHIRARDDVPLRDTLILGLLAGLTILTRVDQGVLLAAIGLDWLLDRRDRRTLVQLVQVGLVALLVNLPWLAFGWSIGAGLLPESGAGVRFNALSQANGRASWFLAALVLALSVILTGPRSTMLLLVVGVVSVLVLRLRSQPVRWPQRLRQHLRPLRFAAFYSIAMLLAYWLYIPAYWFFDRYLHPIAFFALLAGAIGLPDPHTLALRPRRVFGGLVLAFLLIEAAFSARYLLATPQPDGYLTIARWVQANMAGQTVGAYQAGAIGYWADQTQVVVLDGVVDRTALEARQTGRMGEELRQRGVDWVLDWVTTAGLPGDGDLGLEAPQEIPEIQTWGRRWYLFKVKE